jgi:hypothetical protein
MVLCSFMMGLLVKLLLYELKVFHDFGLFVPLRVPCIIDIHEKWHVGDSSNASYGSLIFFGCIGGLKLPFASTKHRLGSRMLAGVVQLLTEIVEACVVLGRVAQILVYFSLSFYA